MSLRAILLSTLFVLPVTLFAGITGTYKVSGVSPATHEKYKGTVVISQSGHVYNAIWTFSGGNTDTGTGVRKDNFISFVFVEGQPAVSTLAINSGVQIYEIEGKTLKGPWVRINGTRRGFEKITKIHSEQSETLLFPKKPTL